MSGLPLRAADIQDERALVDSYGMLGKGIQEAIEVHNSRLGQMRHAVRNSIPTRVTPALSLCLTVVLASCLGNQREQMQQNEDTIKQQQNEIEDLKRKLRLKEEAEAKVTCHSFRGAY